MVQNTLDLMQLHESSDLGIQNFLNKINKSKSRPRYMVEKLKNSTDQDKAPNGTEVKCCNQSKKAVTNGRHI